MVLDDLSGRQMWPIASGMRIGQRDHIKAHRKRRANGSVDAKLRRQAASDKRCRSEFPKRAQQCGIGEGITRSFIDGTVALAHVQIRIELPAILTGNRLIITVMNEDHTAALGTDVARSKVDAFDDASLVEPRGIAIQPGVLHVDDEKCFQKTSLL